MYPAQVSQLFESIPRVTTNNKNNNNKCMFYNLKTHRNMSILNIQIIHLTVIFNILTFEYLIEGGSYIERIFVTCKCDLSLRVEFKCLILKVSKYFITIRCLNISSDSRTI